MLTFLEFIFSLLEVLLIVLWPFILIGIILGWFLTRGDSSYTPHQEPLPYPFPPKKKRSSLFDEDKDGFLGPDMREEYTRRDIVMKQRNQTFHDQDNFWK